MWEIGLLGVVTREERDVWDKLIRLKVFGAQENAFLQVHLHVTFKLLPCGPVNGKDVIPRLESGLKGATGKERLIQPKLTKAQLCECEFLILVLEWGTLFSSKT